jgi:CarD family transcriptional regulator
MPPETAPSPRRRSRTGTASTQRRDTGRDHPSRPANTRPRPAAGASLHVDGNGQPAARPFGVGDAVVCPHHGVGTVVGRSTRELAGTRREYLTIEVDRGALTLMIPSDEAARGRLRPLGSPTDLRRGLDTLGGVPQRPSDNWQKRRKEALRKLASGDVLEVAELVRDLGHYGATRRLATSDRQLYTQARELLEAELTRALGMSKSRAGDEIAGRLPPILPGRSMLPLRQSERKR